MVTGSCKEDLLDTRPLGTKFDEELVWGTRSTADAFVYQTGEEVLKIFELSAYKDSWTTNAVWNRGQESWFLGETWTASDAWTYPNQ